MADFLVKHLIETYERWDSLNIFRYASSRISNVDIVDEGTMDNSGKISVNRDKRFPKSIFSLDKPVSELFTGPVTMYGKRLRDGVGGFKTTHLMTANTREFMKLIRKNKSDRTIRIHYSFIILNLHLSMKTLILASESNLASNKFSLKDVPKRMLEPYVDILSLAGNKKKFQSLINKIANKEDIFADNTQFTNDMKKATVRILSRIR